MQAVSWRVECEFQVGRIRVKWKLIVAILVGVKFELEI